MSKSAVPVVGRSQTYLTLVGVVVGMLLAGLAVPMIFGESIGSSDSESSSGGDDFTASAGETTTTLADTATTIAGDVAATPGASAGAGAATVGGTTVRSAGGATTGTAPGGAPLTASDRGVTPQVIKVGALILDVATVGRLGVAVAIDPAQQQAGWQSFFDDINARGGINGRKIEPYFRTYDVTDRNAQIAACRYLIQEKGVFAILGGFNLVDPTLCIVEENKTPLISTSSNNPDWVFNRANGRLLSFYPRSGRMMSALVLEMERTKLADKKIGILTDGLNDPGAQVANQLKAILEERGHKVVYKGELADDIPTATSQTPVEVSRMQGAGAEVVVFLNSNAVYGTQFVNSANGQNYRPQYVNSDWASGSGDSTNANMPSSYEGAWAFSFIRGLSAKFSPPPGPMANPCRDVYNQRSGRKLSAQNTTEYGLTMTNCDAVRMFETLARLAGPELTRTGLVNARTQFGAFPSANWDVGSFAANKFDWADSIRTSRWNAGCKCWKPADGFHRPGG